MHRSQPLIGINNGVLLGEGYPKLVLTTPYRDK